MSRRAATKPAGEHTEHVCGNLPGLSDKEFRGLHNPGVFEQETPVAGDGMKGEQGWTWD